MCQYSTSSFAAWPTSFKVLVNNVVFKLLTYKHIYTSIHLCSRFLIFPSLKSVPRGVRCAYLTVVGMTSFPLLNMRSDCYSRPLFRIAPF